jgi:DNA-directed RNA polymerase subunit RPC12/RpoP
MGAETRDIRNTIATKLLDWGFATYSLYIDETIPTYYITVKGGTQKFISLNDIRGLENVLYWCPKCNSEHSMVSKGNTIWCTDCGNGAIVDDTFSLTPLDEDSIIFETQSDWFKKQRENAKKEVEKEDFSFSVNVKLGTLPDYKLLNKAKTSEITGEGTVTINKQGLTFKGVNNGEDLEFTIESKDLPTYGMCTDVSRFYTFYKGKFYEFYPETRCVEKIFLLTEELHRANGGKWKNFKF